MATIGVKGLSENGRNINVLIVSERGESSHLNYAKFFTYVRVVGDAHAFWLQLISCSRFVNMAELHHRCDESSSCSSDELDS